MVLNARVRNLGMDDIFGKASARKPDVKKKKKAVVRHGHTAWTVPHANLPIVPCVTADSAAAESADGARIMTSGATQKNKSRPEVAKLPGQTLKKRRRPVQPDRTDAVVPDVPAAPPAVAPQAVALKGPKRQQEGSEASRATLLPAAVDELLGPPVGTDASNVILVLDLPLGVTVLELQQHYSVHLKYLT